MSTTMADLPEMDADTFIAWAMRQPEGEHYELHDGVVARMPAEGAEYGEIKVLISHRLLNAIEVAALECQVFVGEMSAETTIRTVLEPDLVARCGDRLP